MLNAEQKREDRLSLLWVLVVTLVTFVIPIEVFTWFCCW